jgi:hypothetical protein
MAALNIFGTSDGTAPASSTTAKANFDAQANRFRSIPIENIVTSGLVFNLDAANAKQGIAPYSNGCATADLGWFDLSSSSLAGSLLNFSGCGSSSGWLGAGTVANPYTLALDGTDDYVNIPNSGATIGLATATSEITVAAWFKTTATNASIVAMRSSSSANAVLDLQLGFDGSDNNATGKPSSFVRDSGNAGTTHLHGSTALNDGNWHYLALTRNSSKLLSIYSDTGTPATATDTMTGATTVDQVRIGDESRNTSITNMNGKIAVVHIYNRALTAQELKQNCLAQEGRFTSTAQSICGAP